jgi:hypothetical protein
LIGLGKLRGLVGQIVLDGGVEARTEPLGKHILSLVVNLNLLDVDLGSSGNPIESPLTLLLLDLQGDTLDGALLNSLHEMRRKTGDLIAEFLGGDLADFTQDLLVGVEVSGELLVVFLEQHFSSSLDCLCSNSAHMWFGI